jgi:hypothetical protein
MSPCRGLAELHDDHITLQNGRIPHGVASDLQGEGAGVFRQAERGGVDVDAAIHASPQSAFRLSCDDAAEEGNLMPQPGSSLRRARGAGGRDFERVVSMAHPILFMRTIFKSGVSSFSAVTGSSPACGTGGAMAAQTASVLFRA